MEQSLASPKKKSEWAATEGSFAALLDWLDQGLDTKGQAYLEIRQRLVTYFDRKGCLNGDDLADETLNRVQRRLEEEGTIQSESPAKFCYAIAKYVFLEHLRSGRAREVSDENIESTAVIFSSSPNDEHLTRERETALRCLETCVRDLDEKRREMVIGYYRGDQRMKIENRKRLAQKFGLSMNALSLRTFRLRERLEICVKNCIEKAK